MTTNIKKRYAPEVSPVTIPGLTPPSVTVPTLVESYSITLTCPYISPTLTVIINRAPTPIDKDVQMLRRTVNVSRNGSINVVRASYWPKFHILTYNFEALNVEERDALLNFFKQSAGKEIGLLDYESRQWRGIITNPDIPLQQDGPGCNYSGGFDFQGDLV